MYKDRNYARGRLENTIIRVGKRPVYVVEIPIDGSVHVFYLENNVDKKVKYEELDMSPVPLGFINYNGYSYFAARKPMRRDWRQGLRANNTVIIGRHGGIKLDKRVYKPLAKTILGKYPTFEDSLIEVRELGAAQCAFSRGFGVTATNKIIYKGDYIVGKIKGDTPILDDNYKYLDRVFKESLKNV